MNKILLFPTLIYSVMSLLGTVNLYAAETVKKSEITDLTQIILCKNWDDRVLKITTDDYSLMRGTDKGQIPIDRNISEACVHGLYQTYGPFSRLINIDFVPENDPSTNAGFKKNSSKIHLERQKNWKIFFDQKQYYNFDIVIPGLIYRSRHLGSKGLNWLYKIFESNHLNFLQSVASIHVYGYGSGKFKHKLGSLIMPEYFNLYYNLEEFQYCKKNQIEFLHTYHSDRNKFVYFDGEDPSEIPFSPHHGDIYRKATTDIYLTPESVELFNIDLNHSPVPGDTSDFLQTLQNLIDTPWPLLIHCKGGKHKTGMIAMIFQFLYLSHINSGYKPDFYSFESSPLYLSYITHAGHEPNKKNTDFVKRLLSGELTNQHPKLEDQWSKIISSFSKKFQIEYESTISSEAEEFIKWLSKGLK